MKIKLYGRGKQPADIITGLVVQSWRIRGKLNLAVSSHPEHRIRGVIQLDRDDRRQLRRLLSRR